MKTCNKCKIEIATHQDYCPLCHQSLTGEVDKNHIELYQKLEDSYRKVSKKLQKIIWFFSLISIIILGVINLLDESNTFWSLIPMSAILYLILSIQFSVFTRTRSIGKILSSTVLLILLIFLINIRVEPEYLWSLDYVLPALIIANNITILLILLIKKHGLSEDGKYLILLFLLALLPLILYLMNIIEDPILPITLFASEIITILLMVIFFPKTLFDILKKIFHL